jgi:hypothetical protein
MPSFQIGDNFDPDSNLREESDLHKEKHSSPKTSTDAGTMISTKPVPLNALISIRDNLDPDSNLTEESDLHSQKHSTPKTSTDAGRMTSTKPLLLNAFLSNRRERAEASFSVPGDLLVQFSKLLWD